MPRGGENHAQGGGKISRRTVYFFPPLGNFSCTPLYVYKKRLLIEHVLGKKCSRCCHDFQSKGMHDLT